MFGPRRRLVAGVFAASLAVAAIAHAQPAPPPPAQHSLTTPKLLTSPEVPYPPNASGEATITVEVVVAPDGTVRDAKALSESEPFASAAVDAVKTWSFEPATRDGKAIAARIRLEIAFHPPEIKVEPPPPEPTPQAPPPKPPPKKEEPVEVTVRGEKPEPSRTVTLSRTEVRQIPGTFGDPFRALEIMPGVTPIVTGLPFFFVRGAPPGNVGYFLDGVRVPLLFHVGVGPSVIHPALIDRVDLYPGGYPARFGRFAGGIVSGETVAPDPELHGEWNVRLFDAGAMAETGFDNGKGTILLGGRYSYTAFLLTLFSPSTTLDYWDYQARATYKITPDDQIGVFAFGSYDFLGQKLADGTDLTVFGTQFHRVDTRWDRRLGDKGTMRVAVTLGEDISQVDQDRNVRDRLVGTRSEWTYRLGHDVLFRAGTDLQLDNYEVFLGSTALSPSSQGVANLFPSRTDIAFGTRADLVLPVTKRLEVTPGLRFDLYGSQGATALGVDPRLATRTTITDRVKWLTALGIAHQPPAFVVPVPGFQPGGLVGGLQSAYQESTGVEWEIVSGTIATATVYHNAFYDMSDPLGSTPMQLGGCAPGTFPTDTLAGDRGTQPTGNGNCGTNRFPPGTIGPDRTGGGGQAADSSGSQRTASAIEVRSRGSAYGLELLLKRKLTSRLGGFFSYTLSRSIRTANNQDYIATFDRTHVLNGALAFDLGRNWRAGTRVTFYTGLPKVPDPTSTDTRLPPFFRIDLRLEKRWQLGQRTWISFVAEWMNATLSKEAVSTTCTLQGCDQQYIGPVTIPSIGAEGGF